MSPQAAVSSIGELAVGASAEHGAKRASAAAEAAYTSAAEVAHGAAALPAGDSPTSARHPGQVLEAEYLRPRRITQQGLARTLGISRRRVNELIRGHRGITADTAIRLAQFFGTDAEYWMRLQASWDLQRAYAQMGREREAGAEAKA